MVEQVPADLRASKPASIMVLALRLRILETAVLFLKQHDMVAHIAWEPWTPYGEAIPLADIISGKWDPTSMSSRAMPPASICRWSASPTR